MKCPVCGNVHTSMVCPECGFDSSKDYGRYPTLGPVERIPAASALREAHMQKIQPPEPVRYTPPVSQTYRPASALTENKKPDPVPIPPEPEKTAPQPPIMEKPAVQESVNKPWYKNPVVALAKYTALVLMVIGMIVTLGECMVPGEEEAGQTLLAVETTEKTEPPETTAHTNPTEGNVRTEPPEITVQSEPPTTTARTELEKPQEQANRPEVTDSKEMTTSVQQTQPVEVDKPIEKSVLESISVDTAPGKTTYFVGERLEISGLVLRAVYSDGTDSLVESGFVCEPMKLSTAGKQNVKVTYNGKTAYFTVNVENVWSDWVTELPADISKAKFEIQEKTQYASSRITNWRTLQDGEVGLSMYDIYDRTEYTKVDSGWSEWTPEDGPSLQLKPPANFYYEIEEMEEEATQYRYREMRYDGEYSEWSDWQFDEISPALNRQVESREVFRWRTITVYSTRYYYQVEDGLWLVPAYGDTPIQKDENTAVKTRIVYRYREKAD